MKKLTKTLEGGDNVNGLICKLGVAWLDCSSVNHDARPVESSHSYDHARHVFVTSWYGNICVVPLTTHDSLYTICYQISRLQAETHSICSHRDCIAHSHCVESACRFHSCTGIAVRIFLWLVIALKSLCLGCLASVSSQQSWILWPETIHNRQCVAPKIDEDIQVTSHFVVTL